MKALNFALKGMAFITITASLCLNQQNAEASTLANVTTYKILLGDPAAKDVNWQQLERDAKVIDPAFYIDPRASYSRAGGASINEVMINHALTSDLMEKALSRQGRVEVIADPIVQRYLSNPESHFDAVPITTLLRGAECGGDQPSVEQIRTMIDPYGGEIWGYNLAFDGSLYTGFQTGKIIPTDKLDDAIVWSYELEFGGEVHTAKCEKLIKREKVSKVLHSSKITLRVGESVAISGFRIEKENPGSEEASMEAKNYVLVVTISPKLYL